MKARQFPKAKSNTYDISNINSYNNDMRRSMEDKIWFLNMIDYNIKGIYDYGCADGSLLFIINKILPKYKLIGYDFNQEMISLAKKKMPQATFTTNPVYNLNGFLVNVSSVFHEIHNYSSNPKEDYNNIFNCGASYIAIRDMFYSENSCHATNKINLQKLYQNQPIKKINDFESIYGSLNENKNFLHYLLTYMYNDNWEREVRENYFPHSLEEFIQKIPKEFNVIYINHYTLPFLKEKIHNDFGFFLEDFTHAKIFLRRI